MCRLIVFPKSEFVKIALFLGSVNTICKNTKQKPGKINKQRKKKESRERMTFETGISVKIRLFFYETRLMRYSSANVVQLFANESHFALLLVKKSLFLALFVSVPRTHLHSIYESSIWCRISWDAVFLMRYRTIKKRQYAWFVYAKCQIYLQKCGQAAGDNLILEMK